MKLISSFGIALIATLATADAYACSCMQLSVPERFANSKAVVLVNVISTVPESIKSDWPGGGLVPGQRILVKVIKVWKGKMIVGKTVRTTTVLDSGACGRPARPGENLLVYSRELRTVSVDHCSVVAESRVSEHLKELDALSRRSDKRPNKSLERTRER